MARKADHEKRLWALAEELFQRVEQMAATPAGRAWFRLCDILRAAQRDPDIAAFPPAVATIKLLLDVVGTDPSARSPEEALRALEDAVVAIHGDEARAKARAALAAKGQASSAERRRQWVLLRAKVRRDPLFAHRSPGEWKTEADRRLCAWLLERRGERVSPKRIANQRSAEQWEDSE